MMQHVPFGSPLYHRTLAFREDHLRRPLGLELTADDRAGEDSQVHLVAIESGAVLGTVILNPVSPTTMKLRQMAVAPQMRGTGLGRALVAFAEGVARERGFGRVDLAARLDAKGFYGALGYVTRGEVFLEVGIQHIAMTKTLAV